MDFGLLNRKKDRLSGERSGDACSSLKLNGERSGERHKLLLLLFLSFSYLLFLLGPF